MDNSLTPLPIKLLYNIRLGIELINNEQFALVIDI